MATVNEIVNNVIVSFKSLNTTDPNTYYGGIRGEITYDIAKTYRDVEAYHNSVLTHIPGTLPAIQSLQYFLLKIPNESTMICFAKEWVDEATLVIVTKMGKLSIDVIDIIEADIPAVLALLNSNGYIATQHSWDPNVYF